MRRDRLPLTYDECRARFRDVSHRRRFDVIECPIDARGPDGQELTIDAVVVGSPNPRRAFVVLSGVHGVEGFMGSALQCEFLESLDPSVLPDDVTVLVIHAVNPWGMAWWRRQNESNVDLNRNWRRSETEPVHNDAYDELHPLACPDSDTMPTPDELLVRAAELVAARGLPFVRDAITIGQYRHPDGLHYGGERTEASNRILEQLVGEHLAGVERLVTIDLHTGHGPRGAITCLSDAAPGSEQDRFLVECLGADRVEATQDNAEATTATKSGQIANGFRAVFPNARCYSTALEVGTEPDEVQLIATVREQWVHRQGDRAVAEHAAAVRAYRDCFAPDDPEWERAGLDGGARHLARGLAAVVAWSD